MRPHRSDKARCARRVAAPLAMTLAASMLAATAPGATAASTPQSADRYPWEQMQEHRYEVAAGGTLEVRVDDADLEITGTSAAATSVRVHLRSPDMDWARGVFEEMNFRTRQEGSRIIVESDPGRQRPWRRNRWLSVRVEVQIPSRFDVELETNDGDVTLGSLDGRASLVSQDGDIVVDSLAGPRITLETQDGDVRAARLAGGTVELRTQDGDIEIDAISGKVVIDTSDGDIRIAAAAATELRLDTSDGDIHLSLVSAGQIDAATNDGDVSIAAPTSLQADVDFAGEDVYVASAFRLEGRVRDGRAEGRINGGGRSISARTGDGEIRLLVRDSS